MSQPRNWEVVAFQGNSSEAETIKRISDGEVFTIGNYVTNGTKMKGSIERFSYSFKDDMVFVYTDWSGVGMNLDSLQHTTKLPSKHQIGHPVTVVFHPAKMLRDCEVIKVHFTESKVLYDLELMYHDNNGKKCFTRLYNIEEEFVKKAH